MSNYKYILEPYKGMKTRYACPLCLKEKVFVRYINSETNEYLDTNVGKCNREVNCGYHYPPKQYFLTNNISFNKTFLTNRSSQNFLPSKKNIDYIHTDIFKNSLCNYQSNNFIKYLISLFGVDITNKIASKYFIGTSKLWHGSTIFWQIDSEYKIRTGKIMLYNCQTGKRVKKPISYISWIHKTLRQSKFGLKQCLFGEHLLRSNTDQVNNPSIALVESEKTAIIASVYLPQFLWLAVGGLNNLTIEKCSILKGQSITLFPDLNAYEQWYNQIKKLSHFAFFQVSDLLERKATEGERQNGLDLADYLIRFDFKKFTLNESKSVI